MSVHIYMMEATQSLIKAVDGVQYHKITLIGQANTATLYIGEHHVRKEIHKAFENNDMFLDFLITLPNKSYVLMSYTSFIILVSDFVPSNSIAKSDTEIVLVAQVIMDFATIHTA